MTQDNALILHQAFQTYLKKHHHSSLTKIAIAVSGGPDSMALAHIVAEAFEGDAFILTVNHQLRAEAVKEASDVSLWVEGLGQDNVTHHTLNWEHDNPDAAIMEKARMARYELMQDFCVRHEIPLLLTGHHQDDQAETFLIRLIKGSGLDGLSGMEDQRNLSEHVALGRPFLGLCKGSLIEYCDQQAVAYVNDPSNENDDYLRPRLRAFVEGMREEGMDNKLLARTATRLGRAKTALSYFQKEAYLDCCVEEGGRIKIDYTRWSTLPDEIALRVLQQAMENFRETSDYPIRMNKLEDLVFTLKDNPDLYNDRTLGGSIVRLKNHMKDNETQIVVQKE